MNHDGPLEQFKRIHVRKWEKTNILSPNQDEDIFGVRGRERGLNDSTYDSVSPSLNQVELTSSCFARVLNHVVVPGDTSRCFRTLVRDNPSILMRARCTCTTSLLLYTCTDGQIKWIPSTARSCLHANRSSLSCPQCRSRRN